MNALVRWLLMALASALAGAVAHWFEGTCPLDGGSWVCTHWDFVVAVATLVLGALGVRVNRQRLASSKAPQKVESEPLPPAELTPFPSDGVDMPTVVLAGPVKPNPTPPRGFANDGVDTP